MVENTSKETKKNKQMSRDLLKVTVKDDRCRKKNMPVYLPKTPLNWDVSMLFP